MLDPPPQKSSSQRINLIFNLLGEKEKGQEIGGNSNQHCIGQSDLSTKRNQFPSSTCQSFLDMINKRAPENSLKTSNNQSLPKISDGKSFDWKLKTKEIRKLLTEISLKKTN